MIGSTCVLGVLSMLDKVGKHIPSSVHPHTHSFISPTLMINFRISGPPFCLPQRPTLAKVVEWIDIDTISLLFGMVTAVFHTLHAQLHLISPQLFTLSFPPPSSPLVLIPCPFHNTHFIQMTLVAIFSQTGFFDYSAVKVSFQFRHLKEGGT